MVQGEARSPKHLQAFYEIRERAGECTVIHGEGTASRIFKRKRGFITYWKTKVFYTYTIFLFVLSINIHIISSQTTSLRFHNGKHGGLRTERLKLTPYKRAYMEALVYTHAKRYPLSRLGEYVRLCADNGFKMSYSELSKLFKSWCWSFKKPHKSI